MIAARESLLFYAVPGRPLPARFALEQDEAGISRLVSAAAHIENSRSLYPNTAAALGGSLVALANLDQQGDGLPRNMQRHSSMAASNIPDLASFGLGKPKGIPDNEPVVAQELSKIDKAAGGAGSIPTGLEIQASRRGGLPTSSPSEKYNERLGIPGLGPQDGRNPSERTKAVERAPAAGASSPLRVERNSKISGYLTSKGQKRVSTDDAGGVKKMARQKGSDEDELEIVSWRKLSGEPRLKGAARGEEVQSGRPKEEPQGPETCLSVLEMGMV